MKVRTFGSRRRSRSRALGGHLACIDVTPSPIIAGDLYVGFGEAAIISDERGSEAANKIAVRDRLSREDVDWSWVDGTGDIASCVTNLAGLSDLIILNRALDDHRVPDMRAIASQVLAHTHTPIVAMPPSLDRFEFDRALVAWDGRSSAAAALRASVPLLAIAARVEIFTAGDLDKGADPADAAAYLSRYGISAETRMIDRGGDRVDRLIAEECRRWRADYVVMGAYGRGQWREVFGGVTKRMLRDSAVPLLMCH
jgi:nucleotide-binding universal stress UspA family protein